MSIIFTIGHSTRTQEQLIGMLKSVGATAIVDLRSHPMSYHNPQFNAEPFGQALRDAGLRRYHLPALSGRRPKAKFESPNRFWIRPAFRNFADYALTDGFAVGFAELEEIATHERPAIMCAEAVFWRCHRRIVADYAVGAGYRTEHIMGVGKTMPCILPEGTRVARSGGAVKLYYEAANKLPLFDKLPDKANGLLG